MKTSELGTIGAIILVIVLIVTLIVGNPERVKYDQFGIKENVFNGKIDDSQVYTEGLHWVGVSNNLILLSNTFHTIAFMEDEGNSLNTRTQDGLDLTLEVSFQYRLIIDGLIELYKQFKGEYEGQITRVARDVLRDIASAYTGVSFFTNRTQIGNAQQEALNEALTSEYAVEIGDFQLRQIDLPDEFEQRLIDLENAKQDVLISRETQRQSVIEAETLLLIAQKQAEADIIRANGSAEAFLIQVRAQAEAVAIELNATAQALYEFSQIMGFNSTEMLAYLWIDALLEIGEYGNMIIITENTPILATIDPNT